MKQLIHPISTIGRSRWLLAVCMATLGLDLSAIAEVQRRTLITSTPQVPPQVRYTVIELGGRRANDISGSGQIVGSKASTPELYHAAFWASSQSAPIDLGTLPGLRSTAVGMNPRRQIVGFASNEDVSVELPLFWASPNSAPVELPGLPPGLLSEVYDINPSGQIVGQFYSADFSVERAVFWPNSKAAPDVLPMLAIGAFAGLRDAEIKRLDWSEVDARGHIEVKAAKAKSARRRIVPIQPNLALWLRPYAGMTGDLVPVAARGKIERVRRASGLARWPKNGLRHSFSSYRLAAIHDAPRVASELGHTTPQLLYSTYRELVLSTEAERYWRITPQAERENVVAFTSSS